jgi:hypothetical protein
MNKYFDNRDEYISNKRIFEAYFTENKKVESPLKKWFDSFLFMLSCMITALTSARAKSIYRVFTIALCMICFIGTVGAVERGTLSMGVALLIGLALVGIEILCLKKHRHDD